MKILFHIEEPASNGKEELVSIRIGSHHAGYAITDKAGKKLRRLFYINFEEWNEEVENHLLQAKNISIAMVGYGFPDAMLVEQELVAKENDSELHRFIVNNENGETVLTDHINAENLKIIYTVPSTIHEWVQEHFPGADCRHDYSVTLERENQGDYPAAIHADFMSDDFTVLVWKHGKVIQAGNFPYAQPADVLFYLLRICQAFSLSQSSTHLVLSGLIDRQSILFTELYQYFIPVEFSSSGWENSAAHPAHFFASFQKLALCAS